MNRALSTLGLLTIVCLVAYAFFKMFGPPASRSTIGWERWVEPGKLSRAHAQLENNCTACHSPGLNAASNDAKCILCHADNTALLQRSTTSFHANVGQCRSCHVEHQGLGQRPISMNHVALVSIFRSQLQAGPSGDKAADHKLAMWLKVVSGPEHLGGTYPHATAAEAALNCISCHLPQDVHLGYFGKDCVQCHATDTWKLAEYQHPSPQSTQCAECHKPPPSHFMEHFSMVDQRVTGRRQAQVQECFLCHQTTAWNDIKGLGWFQMH